MYDILLLSGKKDLNKIKYVYDSIVENVVGFNKVYCVCEEIPKNKISDIHYVDDFSILNNYDISSFKGNIHKRRGWYIQQYIKLLQRVTLDDYLVVDSDVFFNRKVKIIEDGKPNFLFGRDQLHKPYFDFNNELLGIGRLYPFSFINEVMYFKRDIINDIFETVGGDDKLFFNKTVEILNKGNRVTGMSEFELYGNYVYKNFKNSYNYKRIKTYLGGKYELWSDEDIIEFKKHFKHKDYDIVSMHSWLYK